MSRPPPPRPPIYKPTRTNVTLHGPVPFDTYHKIAIIFLLAVNHLLADHREHRARVQLESRKRSREKEDRQARRDEAVSEIPHFSHAPPGFISSRTTYGMYPPPLQLSSQHIYGFNPPPPPPPPPPPLLPRNQNMAPNQSTYIPNPTPTSQQPAPKQPFRLPTPIPMPKSHKPPAPPYSNLYAPKISQPHHRPPTPPPPYAAQLNMHKLPGAKFRDKDCTHGGLTAAEMRDAWARMRSVRVIPAGRYQSGLEKLDGRMEGPAEGQSGGGVISERKKKVSWGE
ncbi:hypothetical protein K505DRAFT_11384, partial [Melanomma pulvis-pyrius CBS 109.77]